MNTKLKAYYNVENPDGGTGLVFKLDATVPVPQINGREAA